MCIKAGDTELASVKALMTMTLDAMVGKVFGLEPEEIAPGLRLYGDLHMSAVQRAQLAGLVAEYFEGVQLEFTPATTLGDIAARVVDAQFADLPAAAS